MQITIPALVSSAVKPEKNLNLDCFLSFSITVHLLPQLYLKILKNLIKVFSQMCFWYWQINVLALTWFFLDFKCSSSYDIIFRKLGFFDTTQEYYSGKTLQTPFQWGHKAGMGKKTFCICPKLCEQSPCWIIQAASPYFSHKHANLHPARSTSTFFVAEFWSVPWCLLECEAGFKVSPTSKTVPNLLSVSMSWGCLFWAYFSAWLFLHRSACALIMCAVVCVCVCELQRLLACMPREASCWQTPFDEQQFTTM